MPLTSNNGLDLKDILIKLKKFGFYRIFLEAGPCLTSSFFERKLIDSVFILSLKRYLILGKNSLFRSLSLFYGRAPKSSEEE